MHGTFHFAWLWVPLTELYIINPKLISSNITLKPLDSTYVCETTSRCSTIKKLINHKQLIILIDVLVINIDQNFKNSPKSSTLQKSRFQFRIAHKQK